MTDSVPDDERWMRLALKLAEQAATRGEVPVGAVVTAEVGGESTLLGQGSNQVIRSRDPTAHAELVALRQAASASDNYRLPGTTLYVTVEPCTMCAGALVHARVERLVFGAREPRTGAVVSCDDVLSSGAHNHKVKFVEGVLSEACGRLITQFFQEKRR